MAERVYQTSTPPRLITSKPGFNASPSLAETNKTFDSNWFNGCGVKFKFWGPVSQNMTYMYPYALSFVPRAIIQYHRPWDGNTSYFSGIPDSAWSVLPNPIRPGFTQFWQSAPNASIGSDRVVIAWPSAPPNGAYVLIMVMES